MFSLGKKPNVKQPRNRLLVTGGAGFIGHHLVKKLLSLGYEVNVLDDLSTGVRERLPKQVKFFNGNIEDDDVYRAMEGCTAVFHLAAKTDARGPNYAEASKQYSDIIYNTNYTGSKNVFIAAQKLGVKIIFTSSAAVYGDIPIPHKEDAACHPENDYGKSKLKAEKLLSIDNSFVVRLFNVYGPEGNSAINKFCRLIPNYKDVVVYGTGAQTRDYVYVDDVVNALLLGLEMNGLYNVGTAQQVSVLHLIDMISSLTRAKADIKFQPPKKEIIKSKADISKIKQFWHPKVDLENGITLVLKSQGWKPLPIQ